MSDPRWPADQPDERPDPQAADPTQQLPAQPAGSTQPPWEAEVAPRGAAPATGGAAGGAPPYDPEPQPEGPGRGRQIAIGVISGLAGFILAFLVIAIFTGGDDPVSDPGVAASQERIDALEAELAGRDQQIEELEARLADAEAAIGETDADFDAQREALDERATALDQRANALDEREAALDQRERDLNDREAAIAEREQQADDPDGTGDPDGSGSDGDGSDDGGVTTPDIDEEEVQNIVDRVLERLRDLFN